MPRGRQIRDSLVGFNGQTVRFDAHPELVPPGTYTATVLIDAGPIAGSRTLPVTFTVGTPTPTVSSVQNSATLQPGPLVAGSLATVSGHHLGASSVVAFDGQPAHQIYTSDERIILQVPDEIKIWTSTG